jgi:hypothetical protein
VSEEKPKIYLQRTKNCGIAEINLLSIMKGPLEALQALRPALESGITWPMNPDGTVYPVAAGSLRKGLGFPFLIFTGVIPTPGQILEGAKNYGQIFADYITAKDLGGVVTVSAARKNWTWNLIQIWVWEPNYPNIYALLSSASESVPVVPVGEKNAIVEGPIGSVEAQPVGDRLTPREAEEPRSTNRRRTRRRVEVTPSGDSSRT